MLYLLLIERGGKKRKKQQGGIFPREEHALLADPHRIFPTVRCN
jgi:hypothetical protein